MKRSDLQKGDIFEFVESNIGPKIVDEICSAYPMSRTSSSSRLEDDVVLLAGPTFNAKLKAQLAAKETIERAGSGKDEHYAKLSPQPVEVMEAWGLVGNYYRCTALKYLARAGTKAGVGARDDLLKAIDFITREVTSLDGTPSWRLPSSK